MSNMVKLIMAATVAVAIVVPTVGNTLRGYTLSEVTATTVATVLGAIIAGLFLHHDNDDEDK